MQSSPSSGNPPSAHSEQATTGTSHATAPVTKAPEWHGIIAFDALLNGMSTGLFLTAAIGDLAAPAIFAPVSKVAYVIAFVFLLIDLVCLVLDLGDPTRFHHMLRVFKPTSPMSLGTWCLTIYSLPLTAVVGLVAWSYFGIELVWARKLAVVVGLLPAFGSAAYKGVLLSTNSQPGWKDARWLGGYLTNSALMLGTAELLVLSVLVGEEPAAAVLRVALVAMLVPQRGSPRALVLEPSPGTGRALHPRTDRPRRHAHLHRWDAHATGPRARRK